MSKAVRFHRPGRGPQRQQGISLLVVLILLIVMSILGVAVLRSSAMQERMGANLRDRNDAFQAAEIGLRVAQATVIGGTFNAMWNGSADFLPLRTGAGRTCAADGFCDLSDSNSSNWETPPSLPTSWTNVSGSNTSRYGFIVEYLGRGIGESKDVAACGGMSVEERKKNPNCARPMFRVTSFGRGRGMAQVVLQSIVISQPNP